ncbi:MAG: cyclase family protein [Pyrinomonadaceae bacterium]
MKIYDVSVPISSRMPVYEGDPPVSIELMHSIENGDAANVSQICMGVHTGTHVDAPNHFVPGMKKVSELDLNILIGKCRVIELAPDALSVEAADIEAAEGAERVLFKTRNSEFWKNPEQGFRKDFTYIAPNAAEKLVEFGVKLVGIDYLSVEKFGAESPDTHITLLKNEVVIIEGLDLRAVTSAEYELISLPLKIADGAGDGAPARTVLREI